MNYCGDGDGNHPVSRLKAEPGRIRLPFQDYPGEGAAAPVIDDNYFQRQAGVHRLLHEALQLLQLLLVSGGELPAAGLPGAFLAMPGQPGAVLGQHQAAAGKLVVEFFFQLSCPPIMLARVKSCPPAVSEAALKRAVGPKRSLISSIAALSESVISRRLKRESW